MKSCDRQKAWAIGGFTSLILLVFCFFPKSWLVRYPFTDDAFYYAQIARNIALGLGSTFDGIHETNGYHPLWMLFWIPFYKIWGLADWPPLRMILGVQAVLAGLTSFLLYCVFRRWTSSFWSASSVILYQFLAFLLEISFSGMETGLQGCLIALLLYQWPRLVREDNFQALWLGFLLGLIELARLDGGGVALAVGAWSLFQLGKWGWLVWVRRMGLTAGAAFITVAPYFLWNLTHFGHLMPVSGAAKQYPFWESSWLEVLTKLFWWLEAIVVALTSLGLPKWTSSLFVLFSLGAAVTLLWLRRQSFCFPTELALLGSAAVLHYFINALILYTFRGWYLITEILAFSALLSFLVRYDKGGIRLLRLFWLGFYGGLYSFILGWIGMWRLSAQANAVIWEAYEVARWLRTYTRPNDRCASWDAGVIGYFSHRKVINLDGLVNDFQFLTLSDKDLPRYLLENEVKYLTTYFPGRDWTAYWRFRTDTATWARLLREPVYAKHFYHQMPGIFVQHASGVYTYHIWRIDSN